VPDFAAGFAVCLAIVLTYNEFAAALYAGAVLLGLPVLLSTIRAGFTHELTVAWQVVAVWAVLGAIVHYRKGLVA